MNSKKMISIVGTVFIGVSVIALLAIRHHETAPIVAPKAKKKGGCCSDDAELQAKKKAWFAKYAKRQDDGTYLITRESVTGAPVNIKTNDKGQCLESHPCASSRADDPKNRTCVRCSDWRNGCSDNTDMCCCLPYGDPPKRDPCKCQPPDDPPKGPPTR